MALADQSWYIESAFGTKRPQATRLAGSLLAAQALEARRSSPVCGQKATAKPPRQLPLLNTAVDTAVLSDPTSVSQRDKHHRRM